MWWAQDGQHLPYRHPRKASHSKGKREKTFFLLFFLFLPPQFLAAVLAIIKGLSRLSVGQFHQDSHPEGFTNVVHDALVPKDIGILMGQLESHGGLLEEPCSNAAAASRSHRGLLVTCLKHQQLNEKWMWNSLTSNSEGFNSCF